VGEILAKGENIMLGYFNDEEATKAVFRDGWFCTGDYGRMDPDGALYITGRKKNIIVTENGKNIYPEELESRISDYEAVSDVIVVPTQINGRTHIKARIYPNTAAIKEILGHIPSDEEKTEAIKKVVNEVNAAMPKYKNIRAVDILKSPLERTTTRKVKRFGDNVEK
jgi:long-chain acyl-CoA synthetase